MSGAQRSHQRSGGQGLDLKIEAKGEASPVPDPPQGPHPAPPPGSPNLAGQRRRIANFDAVVLVCIVNFMDAFGDSTSTPILPFYSKIFNASNAEVGCLFSAFSLAQTVSLPLLALASSRFGRRTVLLFTLLGTALGSLLQGIAPTYNSLLAARAFSGAWAGVSSVCQVYITDVVPPDHRPSYMSYLLSSKQAAMLFGPSIGAGLSVLGLNVPILVEGAVSMATWFVVLVSLPESPEWLRLNVATIQSARSPGRPNASKPSSAILSAGGLGRRGTILAVTAFGAVAFWSKMAQMAIVSMYAVFASKELGLDSLHVGFATSLGAVASVLTNICISPRVCKAVGSTWAGVFGSLGVAIGALVVLLRPLPLSLLGLMLAYMGMAMNSMAVACGAAALTDAHNRATVVSGVQALGYLGAVLAPVVSGRLAGMHPALPFVGAAAFALCAAAAQLFAQRTTAGLHCLLQGRRAVGLESGLLSEEGWQDEHGTPEEIADLGRYLADLLTSRHYRWVTYNANTKRLLSEFFPPLPIESDQAHGEGYGWVRDRARSVCSQAMLVQERG